MKLKYLSIIILTFFSISMLFQCNITGSGNIDKEDREIDKSFNKIKLDGQGVLKIKESKKYKLSIKTDDNLIKYIETYVDGDTLYIKNTEDIHPTDNVYIEMTINKPITSIQNNGSGSVIWESSNPLITDSFNIQLSGSWDTDININAKSIESIISGNANIKYYGKTDEHIIKISGNCDVKAFSLITSKSNIEISGNSKCNIYAEDLLNIKISGYGDINYKCSPKIIKDISGYDDINNRN